MQLSFTLQITVVVSPAVTVFVWPNPGWCVAPPVDARTRTVMTPTSTGTGRRRTIDQDMAAPSLVAIASTLRPSVTRAQDVARRDGCYEGSAESTCSTCVSGFTRRITFA